MQTQNAKPTQEQMFHQSHRQINDTLRQAYWMAGKMPDAQGNYVEEPLSTEEIRKLANSGRPYAHAFQSILAAMENKKSEAAAALMSTRDQYRAIGVSTAHIPQADRDLLVSVNHTRILSRDTGAFVTLCDAEMPLPEQFPGFSKAFYEVLELAAIAGFEMVEFDADATEYDHLPAFD